MTRSHFLLPAAVGLCSLLAPALAGATTVRSQKTVAGVRATLETYDTAVLAGDGKTACSVMTAAAQAQLAKANHRSSCQAAVTLAGKAFKSEPKAAAGFRAYAVKVKITVHGSTATVPNYNGGGHSAFVYTHSLWYIS